MNPLRGEAPLVVGDVTYKLVLDVNAFCNIEAVLDRDTDQIVADAVMQAQGSGANLKLWRGIFWGAMQMHHPCSLSDAGEIFTNANVVPVKSAVYRAMRLAFGLQASEGGDQSDPLMMGAAGTG